MKPKMWWFKRTSWPHLFARWLMLFSVTGYVFLPSSVVWANPSGEQVVGGAATFHREGNNLTVNQKTDRLAVNWQDFSIAAGERTHFNMPSAASIALNRVLGGNPSQIYGTLSSNGNIILVNNAGIFVGPGGVVNAASFVGSTLDIDPNQFMNAGPGGYHLHGDSYAPIVNQGSITAEKGDVYLIAQKVENRGTISAPNGRAALVGAGRASDRTEVVLHEVGGSGFAVRVAQLEGESATGSNHNLPDGEELLNEGEISAAQAELNASGNIYALAIKNSGTIRAKAVVANADGTVRLDGGLGDVMNTGTLIAKNAGNETTAAGGRIEVAGQNVTASPESIITAAGGVLGGDGGKVKIDSADTTIVQGKVDVTAPSAGAKGGKVQLLGERVGLFDGAKVDASGGAGGGTVLVGGDYLGGQTPKPELKDLAKQEAEPVKNAKATVMADTAEIKADATVSGDGGKVILWSDEYTGFYGELFARGGVAGGNGGFIETSSKDNLQAFGLANTAATLGRGGHWLLDPTSLTLLSGTSVNGSFTGTPATIWTTSPDPASTSGAQFATATVGITPLLTALGLGSVTISTSSTGDGTGYITVNGTITNIGNANSLTLLADSYITINNPITLAGSVSMIAGNGDITLNAALTAQGILGRSSNDINVNGAVTSTGTGTIQFISNGAVTGPGLISLNSAGLSVGAAGLVDISVTSGPVAVDTNGNITLFGGAGTTTVGLVNGINGLSGADISVTAGTIELGGAPVDATGDFTALATTLIDFVSDSSRFSPAVTSGGNQSYQGVISLSADTTLNSSGNMRFNDTIDGAHSLLLLVGGATDLLDQVGATTPLDSFRQEGGLINFYASSAPAITVTGSTTFDGANLVLWNNISFSSGTDLIVLGTIDSSSADVPVTLSVTAGGNVILDGVVGGGAALGALSVTATGGQIAINQGVTTLPGHTPFYPGADGSITLSAGGAVVIAGPIDTRGGLSADTGIGGNLTISSGGGANQNIQLQSNISTRGGTMTFQDEVFFTGVSLLDTTAGNVSGAINFGEAVDGAALATIRGGTGLVSFDGVVGENNPFDMVIASAGGVTFADAVTLGSGASSITSLAGDVLFTSTLDKLGGVFTMTLGNRTATFDGAVGGTNPFGMTVNSAGGLTFSDTVRMGGAFTLNQLSGSFLSSSSISGAFGMTINPVNAGASITLQEVGTKIVGGVETLVPVASLTIGNGNSTTFLNGNITTSGGAINFGSPVTVNESIVLKTTARGAIGGGISLANTLQADSDGAAENLTITAGRGGLTFGDAISGFDEFVVNSAGSMDFTSNGSISAGVITINTDITAQANVVLNTTRGDLIILGGLSARPSNSSGAGATATLNSAGAISIDGLVDVSGRSGTFVIFSPDGSSSATVGTVGFRGGEVNFTASSDIRIGSLNANGGNNFVTGGDGGDGGTVSLISGGSMQISAIQANGGSNGGSGGKGGTVNLVRNAATGDFAVSTISAVGGDGNNLGGDGGNITLTAASGDLRAPISYLNQGGEANVGNADTVDLFSGNGGTVALNATAGSVYFQAQTLTLQGNSSISISAGAHVVLATDLITRSGGVVITTNEGALKDVPRGSVEVKYGSGEFYMPSSAYFVTQGGDAKIYSTTVGAGAVTISGMNTSGTDVNGGSISIHQEAGSVLSVVNVLGALETGGATPVLPTYGRQGGSVKISGTAVSVNQIDTRGSASLPTATAPAFGGAGGDVSITGTTITITSGTGSSGTAVSIDTSGGNGVGVSNATGGAGGSILLNGAVTLNSSDSSRSTVILNTQGGNYKGGAFNGVGGNITVTGTLSGTETTSNTLDLRYGNGTVTLGDAAADTITLGTLITAADDARSTGNLIINGTLDLGTLTTFARGYGVQINGGGTIDNTVTFNNSGVVAIGNAVADTVFIGGLDATSASSTRLQGQIESGEAGASSTGSPMSFGVVQLVGNTSFDTNGGNLNLGSIDGAFDLSFLPGIAAGIIDISSVVGGATPLGTITVSAGITQPVHFRNTVSAAALVGGLGTALTFDGNVSLAGAANLSGVTILDNTLYESQNSSLVFTVGGASTFGGAVTLANGPIQLTSSGAGASFTFNGEVDGAQNLSLTGAGTKTFNGVVGGVAAIGTGAGAAITMSGGAVTFGSLTTASGMNSTDASVSFTGLATLAAGDTATTLNADVTLSGATLVSGGAIALGNAAADTVTLDTGGVTLRGAGAYTVNGAVTGAQTLTLNDAGTKTFASTVSIAGFTQVNGSGLAAFQGNVTTSGASTFNGLVTLSGITFDAGGATILGNAVADTITLDTGGVTLRGAGAYTVNGAVTGGQALTLTGAGTKTFNSTINNASLTQTGGQVRLGGNVSTGVVDLEDAATTSAVTVDSAGQAQTYDSLTLGGSLTAQSGAGLATFGAVGGSGNLSLISDMVDLLAAVRNQGSFSAQTAGSIALGGAYLSNVEVARIFSSGGANFTSTGGAATAATATVNTGLTLNGLTGAGVTDTTVNGALNLITGGVASFDGTLSTARSLGISASSIAANGVAGLLANISVPSLGGITLTAGGLRYLPTGNLVVAGTINTSGNIELSPSGNFVNTYAGNPFTAPSVKILTQDFFSYPNSAGVPGLTPVFGVTDMGQLGADQIGVALPLLAGSAGPYITEFTTGTGQPYILATQENAVPAVMIPSAYTVAGAFPTRVTYSPEDLEMMTPGERSAYEAAQRRQSARVILEQQPGQLEVGVPVEGEIPQAKGRESVPVAPTAQVFLDGKPLAEKSQKDKGDSTQQLRIRPAKAVALRPGLDEKSIMESERMAAEVTMGSAPIVTR